MPVRRPVSTSVSRPRQTTAVLYVPGEVSRGRRARTLGVARLVSPERTPRPMMSLPNRRVRPFPPRVVGPGAAATPRAPLARRLPARVAPPAPTAPLPRPRWERVGGRIPAELRCASARRPSAASFASAVDAAAYRPSSGADTHELSPAAAPPTEAAAQLPRAALRFAPSPGAFPVGGRVATPLVPLWCPGRQGGGQPNHFQSPPRPRGVEILLRPRAAPPPSSPPGLCLWFVPPPCPACNNAFVAAGLRSPPELPPGLCPAPSPSTSPVRLSSASAPLSLIPPSSISSLPRVTSMLLPLGPGSTWPLLS